MKIEKEDIIRFTKAANRNIELTQGRINLHRVHKNKKAYNRTDSKRNLKRELHG